MISRRALVWGGLLSAQGGCSMETTYKDVSHEKQYEHLVGSQYRVIGTLFAYGVRKHSNAQVSHAVLQPPPGFAGPEVGFKHLIPVGTVLVVQKVFVTNRWPDPPLLIN